ncbi:MAG: Lnb N-terminal periplasmic domain-containing protein [Gammaproteobacteria bacterium]
MTKSSGAPAARLSIGRLILRALIALLLLLVTLWAGAALWIDGPASRGVAGSLVGGLFLAALLVAVLVRPWWRAVGGISLLFVVVLGWWLNISPSNDRDWESQVARLPSATLDGSRLTVRNVRSFRYRGVDDFTEQWVTRTYDLDTLVGFDMFISYWGPTLYGHTIASWEFADGQHLAISIETRKEKGETYSAVTGFFRQFEVYYVVADEADVVALRTNHRGERVQLYRTIESAGAVDLLLDYVDEINALAEKPRWYNALTQNCTTTIWKHGKAIGSERIPLDWRLMANGYLVDLGYEVGAVNTSVPLETLKKRSDITQRARLAAEDVDFSEAIRVDLPTRPPAR